MDTETHLCEIDVSVSSAIGSTSPDGLAVQVVNDVLIVDRPQQAGAWVAMLMDASGRCLFTFTVSGERATQSIAHLPSGVYSLVLPDPVSLRSVRLMVAH
jgi:hypothetical protein